MGARYYDPTLGRFTQQDTIVALANPANGNRYTYVGGDPINYSDASGMCGFGCWTGIVAGTVGLGATVAGAVITSPVWAPWQRVLPWQLALWRWARRSLAGLTRHADGRSAWSATKRHHHYQWRVTTLSCYWTCFRQASCQSLSWVRNHFYCHSHCDPTGERMKSLMLPAMTP
jgi:hypothetical protein